MIDPANLTAHVSDGTCMSRAGPDSIGLACSGNQTETTQALSVYFCYVDNDVSALVSRLSMPVLYSGCFYANLTRQLGSILSGSLFLMSDYLSMSAVTSFISALFFFFQSLLTRQYNSSFLLVYLTWSYSRHITYFLCRQLSLSRTQSLGSFSYFISSFLLYSMQIPILFFTRRL
jgi:hypothetical protein